MSTCFFRTNLKLCNNSLTLKMVERVVNDLDLTEESGPDYISLVVCEFKLSPILVGILDVFEKIS